jgi:hypothetical protein
MVFSCAVSTCKIIKTTQELHCFRFPIKNKSLCKVWVSKCRRADKINVTRATICSAHFRPEDYERDFKNELLGLPLRKILKKTAVSSIFCDSPLSLLKKVAADKYVFKDIIMCTWRRRRLRQCSSSSTIYYILYVRDDDDADMSTNTDIVRVVVVVYI